MLGKPPWAQYSAPESVLAITLILCHKAYYWSILELARTVSLGIDIWSKTGAPTPEVFGATSLAKH